MRLDDGWGSGGEGEGVRRSRWVRRQGVNPFIGRKYRWMVDVVAMNIARKSVHIAKKKLQPIAIKTTSIDREGLDPTRKVRSQKIRRVRCRQQRKKAGIFFSCFLLF
jgi:hypothetical protein